MSANEPELPIRQIIVALDASSSSRALLEAAAELAARLQTELVGLFIEDANLVNLAGSPFFREVSHFSATARPLSSEQLERQLRGQANQIRRALTEIAARRHVPAISPATTSAPGHTRGVHSSPRRRASGTRSARSSLVVCSV